MFGLNAIIGCPICLLKYVFTEFTMYVLTVLYILHQILDIILDLHMKRYVVPWYRSQRHFRAKQGQCKMKDKKTKQNVQCT